MSNSYQPPSTKPELELVLMIVADDPQSTAQRLAKLTSIAGYQLIAHPPKTLHDIYLDTADRLLGRKRINLRIRGVDENSWITMKLNPGRFSFKRHERQELEIPWSPTSLKQIVAELAKKDVKLSPPQDLDEHVSHVETMRSMGLQVLQDRETLREVRNIERSGKDDGQLLAELDIDSVTYHLEGQDVRLFELEVEAKNQEGRGILGEVSKSLREDFKPELRSWRFGKLVTGGKIERLRKRGALQSLLAGTTLKSTAYDEIERA